MHIASRLGNVDIVMLLLQHSADLDAVTKDMYTPLHIAAKEGQDEVAAVLLEHGANNTAATKRGFTPLHLAAKYGNIKVARLLIQKDAPVDAQGKVHTIQFRKTKDFLLTSILVDSQFSFYYLPIVVLPIEWRDTAARGQSLRSPERGSSPAGQRCLASRCRQEWIHSAAHRRKEEPSQLESKTNL